MQPQPRIAATTAIGCAALLAVFALLARGAVSGKSATEDESYHAISGWLHLWQHDDRVDSEDPPLWNTWAALANGREALRENTAAYDWRGLPLDTGSEFVFTVNTLYRTAGNDAAGFLRRCRAMMLMVGLALGAGISLLSWRWARAGGVNPAVATLTACGLYALDPNFLAHAPLVKNDVAASAAMLAVVAAVWTCGRRLSLPRVIVLGLACGFALTVKFSGIGLVIIGLAMLAIRAVMPWPWQLGEKRLDRCTHRVLAAAITAVVVSGIGIAMVWMAYGLRFRPATSADSQMDLQPVLRRVIERTWQSRQPGNAATPPTPTAADLQSVHLPLGARLAAFAAAHRLLPQAFVAGLLFTEQSALVRPEFLCGHFSRTGWWWYFPFAIAVKTPTATLALAVAALLIGLTRTNAPCQASWWTTLCWAFPAAAYLAIAMDSNLNLGIRHVLPIYPLFFVAIGLAMAKLWIWRPRATAILLTAAAIGLGAETIAAYPNFIPFFNVMAGGSRGGLRWLGDSNLDWGQDLPLLAAWQRRHPGQKLYLAYFGTADPAYYKIRYTNLPAGYQLGPPVGRIDSPGVIAISATLLQGTYDRDRNGRSLYSWLAGQPPIDVLGGSIYLFAYPPAQGEMK